MKLFYPAVVFALLFTSAGIAADLSAVPEHPIAEKKELLFSDDFKSPTPNPLWHEVVPTFTFTDGMLIGHQKRDKDIPATDGKPAVKAHPAIEGLDIPTKDSIVEVKIRFADAKLMDVEFDDRHYTGSHYGHLCRAQVRLDSVRLIDERDGDMRNDIFAMREDPSKRAEHAKLLKGRSATFPAKLEPNRWYTFTVEVVGDEMRASIDGHPAGYLKSSGIGHPTKSKIELGVLGKNGQFGEIKVWNAAPAQR